MHPSPPPPPYSLSSYPEAVGVTCNLVAATGAYITLPQRAMVEAISRQGGDTNHGLFPHLFQPGVRRVLILRRIRQRFAKLLAVYKRTDIVVLSRSRVDVGGRAGSAIIRCYTLFWCGGPTTSTRLACLS